MLVSGDVGALQQRQQQTLLDTSFDQQLVYRGISLLRTSRANWTYAVYHPAHLLLATKQPSRKVLYRRYSGTLYSVPLIIQE